MRTVCREIGRSGLEQTNGAGRVQLVDTREKKSSAAARECPLNGVRADCVCGVCVCPCLGDPKEQSGGATVVNRLCYFRGVRVVRNFAYVRIIRIPHHFTRTHTAHIQYVCVSCGFSSQQSAVSW